MMAVTKTKLYHRIKGDHLFKIQAHYLEKKQAIAQKTSKPSNADTLKVTRKSLFIMGPHEF
jgi:hypothetical protein